MELVHRSIIRQTTVVLASAVKMICGVAWRSSFTLLVALGIFFPVADTQANDTGQYRQLSPEIEAWTKALTNEAGVGCCTTQNGVRPTEVEWDISANSYRVKINGKWLLVPDEAVVRDPNRLGYPAVWYEIDHDLEFEEYTIEIRCFLPGAAI